MVSRSGLVVTKLSQVLLCCSSGKLACPFHARFRACKTPLPDYSSNPSCARPTGVRSSAVARPVKSTSKWSAGKSGGLSPFRKLGNWRLRLCVVFGACGRRGDVHHIAIARAFMLVFDCVDDIAMPKHSVARFHFGNR